LKNFTLIIYIVLCLGCQSESEQEGRYIGRILQYNCDDNKTIDFITIGYSFVQYEVNNDLYYFGVERDFTEVFGFNLIKQNDTLLQVKPFTLDGKSYSGEAKAGQDRINIYLFDDCAIMGVDQYTLEIDAYR